MASLCCERELSNLVRFAYGSHSQFGKIVAFLKYSMAVSNFVSASAKKPCAWKFFHSSLGGLVAKIFRAVEKSFFLTAFRKDLSKKGLFWSG